MRLSKSFRPLALILTGSAALATSHARNQALDLHWAFVDIDTVASGASTIAVDGNGNIKVGYRSSHDIRFGVWSEGKWKTELADTGTGGDAQMSMALDNEGEPHIVFHDASYRRAMYTWRHAGVWKEKVAATLNIENLDFYESSIKVNAAGDSYMAFAVKYGNWPGISITKADKDGNITPPALVDSATGKWNSLTLDAQGNPLLAYYRILSSTQTMVGYLDNGVWKSQPADSGDYPTAPGYYPSIVRDASGICYITYFNKLADRDLLMMATGTPGGTWTLSVLDTVPTVTIFSTRNSLAMDSKGRLYVAYNKLHLDGQDVPTSSSLILAYKDKGDSVWTRQTLDTAGGVVGGYVSMALNGEETPVLSYMALDRHTLRSALSSKSPIVVSVRPRAIPSLANRIWDFRWFNVKGQSYPGAAPKASSGSSSSSAASVPARNAGTHEVRFRTGIGRDAAK